MGKMMKMMKMMIKEDDNRLKKMMIDYEDDD